MPRTARRAPGGIVYHIINRGVGRTRLFRKPGDYLAFEEVIADTLRLKPIRLCAYCLMPNHWHLILWPQRDGQLAAFMQRLTITHVRRWQEHRGVVGSGHLYQGRYKSFPVQSDPHYLTLCRYVERNALRAGLVRRAENWRWSSLWRREDVDADPGMPIADGPVDLTRGWVESVNRPQSAKELEAIRICINRGRPFGSDAWTKQTVRRLGLESSQRPRGRPPKKGKAGKSND
jgi:putative transposase